MAIYLCPLENEGLKSKSGKATRKILLHLVLMTDIKQAKKKKKKKMSSLIHQVRTYEYIAKPVASLMEWPSRKC